MKMACFTGDAVCEKKKVGKESCATYLVDPCLRKGKGREDESMYGEKDVICADQIRLTIVPPFIFLLNLGAVEEG